MHKIIISSWVFIFSFSQFAVASDDYKTPRNTEPHKSSSSKSRPLSNGISKQDSCLGKLTEEEKQKLNAEMTSVFSKYLQTQKGEDLQKDVARIFEKYSDLQDSNKKAAVISELGRTMDALRQAGSFLKVLSDLEKGKKTSSELSQAKYDELRQDYDLLKNRGIKYDFSNSKWDLSGISGSDNDLNSFSAREKQAIEKFFSPAISEKFFDPDRREAFSIGDWVIRPPRNSGDQGAGQFQVVSKKEQDQAIKRQVDIIASEKETFLRASKEANGFINSITGRVAEYWFGAERGYQGKTAPEIERDGALKTMASSAKFLRESLGVDTQTVSALNSVIQDAITTDSRGLSDLDERLSHTITALKVAAGSAAVIGAFATAGLVAPGAMAGMTATVAGTGTTGVLSGSTGYLGAHMAVTAGLVGASALARAKEASHTEGKTFSCAALEELSKNGPDYVAMTLVMGAASVVLYPVYTPLNDALFGKGLQ